MLSQEEAEPKRKKGKRSGAANFMDIEAADDAEDEEEVRAATEHTVS